MVIVGVIFPFLKKPYFLINTLLIIKLNKVSLYLIQSKVIL